jgi:hypothetical protein
MRKRRLSGVLIFAIPAVLAAATIAVAESGKTSFKSDTLTGYQEAVSPGPISTIGTGTFEAEVDGEVITYTLTYRDLEGVLVTGGVVTQAHIHFGQRGVAGGVIAFLCGGPKPACPPSPATVTGTITPADIAGPANQGIEPGSFDEAVRAIRAGAVYANVHTTRWPSGEIRGQVNDQDQRN